MQAIPRRTVVQGLVLSAVTDPAPVTALCVSTDMKRLYVGDANGVCVYVCVCARVCVRVSVCMFVYVH